MTGQADELLNAAMELPPESRAELAASLLSSLEEVVDEDASTVWRIEVANRLEELDTGKVRAVPRDDVQGGILLGMLLGTE